MPAPTEIARRRAARRACEFVLWLALAARLGGALARTSTHPQGAAAPPVERPPAVRLSRAPRWELMAVPGLDRRRIDALLRARARLRAQPTWATVAGVEGFSPALVARLVALGGVEP